MPDIRIYLSQILWFQFTYFTNTEQTAKGKLLNFNINFQIDEIILEGVSLSRNQRSRLQATLEAELSSLVNVNGLPPQIQQGGTIPKLSVTPKINKEMNPTQMGQEIARSIYGGLQDSTTPPC